MTILSGLRPIDPASLVSLTTFNDRLLGFAGGSKDELPAIGPEEAVRLLSPFKDEAHDLFRNSSRIPVCHRRGTMGMGRSEIESSGLILEGRPPYQSSGRSYPPKS